MNYTYGVRKFTKPAKLQVMTLALLIAIIGIGIAATPRHYSDAAYIKSLGIKRIWTMADPEVAAYLESQAEYEDILDGETLGTVTGVKNGE